jgi:uncharacterized SAM-binding protein YcdF (DUF218 family)
MSDQISALTPAQRHAARVLWDFHNLTRAPDGPVDAIIAAGSHDLRVAEYAADLMVRRLAPVLVVSGGYGKVTAQIWKETEADKFADVARSRGVRVQQIIVEPVAANTGENVTLSRERLEASGYTPKRLLFVTKPYMKRRAYATATMQWPGVEWFVDAPTLTFDEYPNQEVPLERMVNLMVGDLQRIKLYGGTWQTPQDVPDEVWSSYNLLVDSGFDNFVLPERDEGSTAK